MFLFESIAKIHNELQNHRNEILDCRLPVIFYEFDFFNLGKTMMSLFWLFFARLDICTSGSCAISLHQRGRLELCCSHTLTRKFIKVLRSQISLCFINWCTYMYIYLLRNKQRILYVPFKVKLTWIVKLSYYSYFDQIRIQIPPGNRDRIALEGICYRICFLAV